MHGKISPGDWYEGLRLNYTELGLIAHVKSNLLLSGTDACAWQFRPSTKCTVIEGDFFPPRRKSQAIWRLELSVCWTALIYAFQRVTLTCEHQCLLTFPPFSHSLLHILLQVQSLVQHFSPSPSDVQCSVYLCPGVYFSPSAPLELMKIFSSNFHKLYRHGRCSGEKGTREGLGHKHKHSLGRASPFWLRNEGSMCPSQRLMGKYWPSSMAPLRFARVSVRLSGVDAHRQQFCWGKLLRGAISPQEDTSGHVCMLLFPLFLKAFL